MLDFLGIGAQKAGTTWLYERLSQHPQIQFPHIKEIAFWDAHYPLSLEDPSYKRDLEWYRRLFRHGSSPETIPEPVAFADRPRTAFERGMIWLDKRLDKQLSALPPLGQEAPVVAGERMRRLRKMGEISPSYCYFDRAETLHDIRNFAPNLKIIYMVRHPFARAWSAAKMALKRAEMRVEEASDQWFIDHFRSEVSLKYGDYERAITSWCAVFPERQFLLLQQEDIKRAPQDILRRCCEHIGVEKPSYFNHVIPAKLGEKVFEGGQEPLRQSLVPVLQELYGGRIARLKERYGIDYLVPPVSAH